MMRITNVVVVNFELDCCSAECGYTLVGHYDRDCVLVCVARYFEVELTGNMVCRHVERKMVARMETIWGDRYSPIELNPFHHNILLFGSPPGVV